MTAAAWITVAVMVLFGGTGGGGVVYFVLNRNSERVKNQAIEADRESTLADAAKKWQEVLDESSTKAYQTVKAQCDECSTRLALTEKRLAASEEQRRTDQRDNEERLRFSEERQRLTQAALRKTIRALDSDDQTTIDAAIAAGRLLI